MADLFPLRALRYTAGAGGLSALVLSSPGEPETGSPHGAGRLLRGGDERARQWQKDGILRRESAPAFYIYEQEFRMFGRDRAVRGIVGLLDPGAEPPALLEEAGERGVRAEESAVESGSLSLFSAAFLFRQDDPAAAARMELLSRGKPRYRFQKGGAVHRLWVVNDTLAVRELQKDFAGKKLLLAGSTARYEALLRRREYGGRVPALLMDAAQSGVTPVPYHCAAAMEAGGSAERLLAPCAPFFDLISRENPREIPANLDALYRQGKTAFAAYTGGPGWTLMILKDRELPRLPGESEALRRLDATVFRRLVQNACGSGTEPARWVPSMEEAMRLADEAAGTAAFLLNPPRLKHLEEMAAAGEKLPARTVSFLPQMPPGLLIFTP